MYQSTSEAWADWMTCQEQDRSEEVNPVLRTNQEMFDLRLCLLVSSKKENVRGRKPESVTV
jgi:hypothetical protein